MSVLSRVWLPAIIAPWDVRTLCPNRPVSPLAADSDAAPSPCRSRSLGLRRDVARPSPAHPRAGAVEIAVDHRRDVEGQHLAQDQSANHREAQRLPPGAAFA